MSAQLAMPTKPPAVVYFNATETGQQMQAVA